MSRFHRLAVESVRRETRDAVVITLAVPPALAEAFRFSAGQHLTLRREIDGADVRRSYSICSGERDGVLRIAVKRNPGGVFSTWANEALRAGDALDVLPPLGHFNLSSPSPSPSSSPSPSRRRRYVAFAAGSGITPILSLVKTAFAADPDAEFTLFYGNRATSTVMFRDELAALKDVYLTRFNLVHVLSREAQDVPLLHGRIDAGKAALLLAHWVDLDGVDAVFVCGPDGMMRSVLQALAARGFPEARTRVERFATSVPRAEHRPKAAPPGHAACRVTAVLDGATLTFALDKGSESILDAGLRAGYELPYSCKSGVCSTCRAKLVAGEADMDANYALEDYELARGFVLTCQCHPVSDEVTVDYDQSS